MISRVRGVRRAAGRILRAAPLHVAPLVLWRKCRRRTWASATPWFQMVPVQHLKHYRFLDTDTFEADLDYLSGHFEFVTYEELARRRSSMNLRRRHSLIHSATKPSQSVRAHTFWRGWRPGADLPCTICVSASDIGPTPLWPRSRSSLPVMPEHVFCEQAVKRLLCLTGCR
jgi:hypothetical protein